MAHRCRRGAVHPITVTTTSRQLAHNHDLALRVDGVNLKSVLAQIEPDPRDNTRIPDKLVHGRLPFRWGFDNDHLGTLMPFGAPSTPSWEAKIPMERNGQGRAAARRKTGVLRRLARAPPAAVETLDAPFQSEKVRC
jgi:hypothetical protein